MNGLNGVDALLLTLVHEQVNKGQRLLFGGPEVKHSRWLRAAGQRLV